MMVGDLLRTEGFFQGVTKEPMKWVLQSKQADQFIFDATYMGIPVGQYAAMINHRGEIVVEAL